MIRKTVIAGVLLIALCAAVAQAVVTTTIGSAADTYLRDATVRGALVFMDIRGQSYDFAGYARFDLSTLNIATITNAKLTLTVSGGASRNDNITTARFALHGLNNVAGNTPQNWDEATLSESGTNPVGSEWNGVVPLDLTMGRITNLDAEDVAGITETLVGGGGVGTTVAVTGTPLVSFLQGRADDNGLVTFIISDDDAADRGYGLGTKENTTVAYRPVLEITYIMGGAKFPQPGNGSTVNKDSLSELSWTLASGLGTYKCDVYFGTEPNLLTMDKLTFEPAVESVDINDFTNFSTPLAEDTYYWRVDCYNDPNTEPNLPGPFWSFIATSLPVITQQPMPTQQLQFEGATAEFTISVNSSTTVTYAWYRSPDNVNNTPSDDVSVGTNSSTLTLSNLTWANEGYYYCKATNSGGSVYSNTACLVVGRELAHWAMDNDANGWDGTYYLDETPTATDPVLQNADPNGTPDFVANVNGTPSSAVAIDPNNGWATVGTFNPTAISSEFTLSMWVKWAGPNGTYQGLLSKSDAWDAANNMWQLEMQLPTDNNVLHFKRYGGATVIMPVLAGGTAALPIDEWAFVAVTFNGTTATIYRLTNTITTVQGSFTLGTPANATFRIGSTVGTGLTFNGVIDDVQVFNYAKNARSIVDLHNEVLSGNFCVDAYSSTYDPSANCKVDLPDLMMFVSQWLNCGRYPDCP